MPFFYFRDGDVSSDLFTREFLVLIAFKDVMKFLLFIIRKGIGNLKKRDFCVFKRKVRFFFDKGMLWLLNKQTITIAGQLN